MGYYCRKEDCNCPHYFNHVCYIEDCSYEEAKAFECEIKPEIKETHRNKRNYSIGVSYYDSNSRGYTDDGYYRNN